MQIYRAHEAILRWMGLQCGYQLIVISRSRTEEAYMNPANTD